MNKKIFRESSIDRLRSPEQLNEYIHVARPSVWIVLAAIVLLLAGAVIWGIFGSVGTVLRTDAYVRNGTVVCYVPEEEAAGIQPGQPVSINDRTGEVLSVSDKAILKEGDSCREVFVEVGGLKDGDYIAEITVESIHPISFIISGGGRDGE